MIVQYHAETDMLYIEFAPGISTEIMERICFSKKDSRIIPTKYSFHWQNANSKIIRRWDNAPHHPEIQTYPYHVHEDREQNAKAALQIADRGYIMETGRIIFQEKAKSLMENQEVRRAYLGKDKKEIQNCSPER